MKRLMNGHLAVRFGILLIAILFASVAIYSFYSSLEQREASEQKVLEEARLLTQQMSATWDYIDSVQGRINYNDDGRYDFKGVYCSVAGKNIAHRFTQQTDCFVRYTRHNPRSGNDEPDEFESRALEAFESGSSEYYAVTEYQGEMVFRYVSSIYITRGCLTCHGNPAGELDETGFIKEGYTMGDVAGGLSLIIPMDQYVKEAGARAEQNVVLFIILAVSIVVCMSLGLYRWVVRPLRQLAETARKVGTGCFDGSMGEVRASGEIAVLARELSSMELSLKNFYDQLEEQVKSRTLQLMQANELLEQHRDKINQTNEQLVEANRLLREENEYKTTFLATMSHELRTPLASIIAFADVLLRPSSGLDKNSVAIIEEIQSNSKELLSTIDKTLDAARIEANRFVVNIAPVDLLDVANSVESIIAPLAAEKGISFYIDIDDDVPLVKTDSNIVHKVLLNLLGNAVKFTDEGEVRASIEVDETNCILFISVVDTGIGIAEEDITRIFDRFRQVDSSSSRSFGGSGLGLALVKELTGLLDGRVDVKSSVGEGSSFTVELPYDSVGE